MGTRHIDTPPMADQAALARTTALLRGTAHLAPRGVYRFSSFEEADAWMTQMMLRTHAHPRPEDLLRICRALNDAGALYVLIIDLMGRACGLTYADVAADMEWHDLAGVRVPVASPSALVRTKDTYRPQDAIDRAFLHQLMERRQRE